MRSVIPFSFLSFLFLIIDVAAQTPEEWRAHRQEFMRHLGPNSVAVFKAAEEYTRNGDVEFPYRQDSNFYYLTGMSEKESMLILAPAGLSAKEILFVKPRNPIYEIREGKLLGVEGANAELGLEQTLPNDQFEEHFRRALAHADTLYLVYHGSRRSYHGAGDDSVRLALEEQYGANVKNAAAILSGMREIKSPPELQLLRQAIAITCEAQREAMRAAKPGMREYELQAIIEYVFTNNGSPRVGFPSIVGSGPNSCILHYRAGTRIAQAGELVLIDIGAEYGMYTADVTRTFPINGKFTPEQAAIYNLVLKAQTAAMAKVRPGVGFREPGETAVHIITQGLIDLGMLKGTVEENLETRSYRDFFMHGTSHYLGLDVHDTGTYGKLRPGTVITVEPGIYISEATAKKYNLPAAYANIGVRIEDDILVTENGFENLSIAAPRTIAEIEALIAESGLFDEK